MAIYDYSPTKVELQSHIQFFSGGRCNVTLGGDRSIQLSYGDMYGFSLILRGFRISFKVTVRILRAALLENWPFI